ncbi:MAG TPA: SCO family protein [Myxococcaceae bacterium]|nr:SCO family protein [Myxococcaceae bacterium]
MSTDTASPSSPLPSPSASKGRYLWVALLAAAGLVALGVGLLRPRAEPLERLGTLPSFTFTRQDGQPFGTEQLKGRTWVANFIFTRCPTVCPVFTQKMARVQKRTAALGERLRLVSFSVDPQYDTPERLAAYAEKYGAQPARWSFLTGEYTRLKDTIVNGFKVSMGRESADENDVNGIFHGTHFVLVDGSGEIRGYYNSEHDDAVERLLRDAERLVESGE